MQFPISDQCRTLVLSLTVSKTQPLIV